MRDNGTSPETLGVQFGVASEDIAEELGVLNVFVIVGDLGVVGAIPVAVPGSFRGAVAPRAGLEVGVAGVAAGGSPSGALEGSVEGRGEVPEVAVAEVVVKAFQYYEHLKLRTFYDRLHTYQLDHELVG